MPSGLGTLDTSAVSGLRPSMYSDLPTQIPILKPSPYPQEPEALDYLSSVFSLTNPSEFKLNDFRKWTWKKDNIELTYYPETHVFHYFNPAISDGKAMEHSNAIRRAIDYISTTTPLPQGFTLTPYITRYLSSNGTSAEQLNTNRQANLNEIIFEIEYEGFPIYYQPLSQKNINIQLNDQGVRSFRSVLVPSITKESLTQTLISPKVAQEKLLYNQGIIVSADNNDYQYIRPGDQVPNIQVNNINIGYIETEGQLLPIYIFIGKTSAPPNTKTQRLIKVAVSAI
jgi:hypothetical protein